MKPRVPQASQIGHLYLLEKRSFWPGFFFCRHFVSLSDLTLAVLVNVSFILLQKVKHCNSYVLHVFTAVCTTLTVAE